MSEPVLYVDMLGVIYSSLPEIQPAPEPKDINSDITDGWQLLEQDAKIDQLQAQLETQRERREMNEPVLYVNTLGEIFNLLPSGFGINLPVDGWLLLERDIKIQELQGENKCFKQLNENQRGSICCFQKRDRNTTQQLSKQDTKINQLRAQLQITDLRKAHDAGEIQRLKEQVLKYQKDISYLLYGRPADTHPGKVIDAQEKIISKLQSEVKEQKQRAYDWGDTADKQNTKILELQSEVKELEIELNYHIF